MTRKAIFGSFSILRTIPVRRAVRLLPYWCVELTFHDGMKWFTELTLGNGFAGNVEACVRIVERSTGNNEARKDEPHGRTFSTVAGVKLR